MFSKNQNRNRRDFFGSASGRKLLETNGLDRFESIWAVNAAWVEEPNYRRQGWSGVCRIELQDEPKALPSGVYLKRQEGHCYRSFRPPFRMRPTAYRECRNLMKMKALCLAAPEVLYYGERRVGSVWQAILMTREIPQSISLEAYMRQSSGRPYAEVKHIITETASLIGRFHRQHLEHGALYGKHIMIGGFNENPPSAAQPDRKLAPHLIDLEKARLGLARWLVAVHDLNQFYRHMPWGAPEWRLFLDQYVAASGNKWFGLVLTWLIRWKVHRKHVDHRHRNALSLQPLPLKRSSKAI